MIVDSALAPVRMLANDAKDLCQGSFTYTVLVSLLSGLFFGLPSLSAIARAFNASFGKDTQVIHTLCA